MISKSLEPWSLGRLLPLLIFITLPTVYAASKARPWTPRSIETYPSRLIIEGLTIAADPLILDALAGQDFSSKFLSTKRVEPHATAGGFIYLLQDVGILRNLASAKLYLPKIYRRDNGAEMMFFEIDLKAAIDAAPKKEGQSHRMGIGF